MAGTNGARLFHLYGDVTTTGELTTYRVTTTWLLYGLRIWHFIIWLNNLLFYVTSLRIWVRIY
jgi:hypothetical protein